MQEHDGEESVRPLFQELHEKCGESPYIQERDQRLETEKEDPTDVANGPRDDDAGRGQQTGVGFQKLALSHLHTHDHHTLSGWTTTVIMSRVIDISPRLGEYMLKGWVRSCPTSHCRRSRSHSTAVGVDGPGLPYRSLSGSPATFAERKTSTSDLLLRQLRCRHDRSVGFLAHVASR
jgi:hypothetical protein